MSRVEKAIELPRDKLRLLGSRPATCRAQTLVPASCIDRVR